MPRLPRNIVRRGRKYYFRMEINGKQIKRSLGDNLVEAKRKASLLRQEVREVDRTRAASDLRTETHQTVRAFSTIWLSDYVRQRRKGNRKGTGVQLATQRLNDYVLPIIGERALAEVQIPELRLIRSHCEARKLSPQTVRHILSEVRCLLRYALEIGEVFRVPSFSRVLPKVVEKAPRRLTDDQIEAIRAALLAEHVFAVELALGTGLRWGELRALQWRHVVWKPSPHVVIENTKSGKVRRVPLGQSLVQFLTIEFKRTSSVFVIDPEIKAPEQISRRVERRCGFHWHWHQFRHTFACRWLEDGGSKEVLQRILGHATIQMTERYGALSDEAVFSEADRVQSRTTSRTTLLARTDESC